MEFIYEENVKKKQLTFDMVVDDQFFINSCGYLCQRVNSVKYNVIAKPEGFPYAISMDDVSLDTSIKRILPKVVKIEF